MIVIYSLFAKQRQVLTDDIIVWPLMQRMTNEKRNKWKSELAKPGRIFAKAREPIMTPQRCTTGGRRRLERGS